MHIGLRTGTHVATVHHSERTYAYIQAHTWQQCITVDAHRPTYRHTRGNSVPQWTHICLHKTYRHARGNSGCLKQWLLEEPNTRTIQEQSKNGRLFQNDKKILEKDDPPASRELSSNQSSPSSGSKTFKSITSKPTHQTIDLCKGHPYPQRAKTMFFNYIALFIQ